MRVLFTLIVHLALYISAQSQLSSKITHNIQSLSGTHVHHQLYFDSLPVLNYYWVSHHSRHSFSETKFAYEWINFPEEIEKFNATNHRILTNENPAYAVLSGRYLPVTQKHFMINEFFPYSAIYHNDSLLWIQAQFNLSKDTNIQVQVFEPNPIVSSQTTYGNPLKDNNDSNTLELQNELIVKESFVHQPLDSIFILENKFIKIAELSAPSYPVPKSLNNQFLYNRSDSSFEAVNAFYHLNKAILYLRDTLGFNSLMEKQIWVDANALGGNDLSMFLGNKNPPELYFGVGGVDDAEDAQVIIHELSHAMLYSANPESNVGMERNSLDEGVADYFACSYSKSISSYAYEKVFSWDGHNEFWQGRVCNSDKKYPTNLTANIYENAEIWSSVLMEIEQNLGRYVTQQIVIESAFFYYPNMSFTAAGNFLLKADSLINGGLNNSKLKEILCEKGILSSCSETEIDFSAPVTFNQYSIEKGILSFSANVAQFEQLNIYSANGQLIFKKNNNLSDEIDLNYLSKGTYILELINTSKTIRLKMVLK